jgi:hypothetical protein
MKQFIFVMAKCCVFFEVFTECLNIIFSRFGFSFKILPMMGLHVPTGGPLLAAISASCECCDPSVFALRLTHFDTLETGKLTRIWDSIFRRPHQSTN